MKLFFLLSLVLIAFSANAEVAKDIVIEQAYVRAAIKQQRNSAAYMNITNNGDNAAISYAKSPSAKIVELHTHINDKGVMRMRKIDQIELSAQSMVQLKPGGLHIMLLGLNRNLKPGGEVEVTLGFADGSEKLLQIPVQRMRMGNKKGEKKDMKRHMMDGSLPKMMTH